MNDEAGRTCPIRYRYGAGALARAQTMDAEILYVIGGLYGNLPALNAIEAMARAESGPVTLCFNGDFNWFNVDDQSFGEINRRVLAHQAIVGNVEAELGVAGSEDGCGCAYPESVDEAVVQRSNRIHARLKATAARFPEILDALASMPMYARYRVGDCRIGVVHGDADSLSGWLFDASEMDRPAARPWLAKVFDQAQVDVFASTHTCLAAMRKIRLGRDNAVVVNNGAAGMPNFDSGTFGIITRISARPGPHRPCYGTQVRGVHVEALPVEYDQSKWRLDFLRNWPEGSDAHQSYFDRISNGTRSALSNAVGDVDDPQPEG
ncbi:MAG: hypothetical protein ABI771_18355 [Betaproteobacteria bacterium]